MTGRSDTCDGTCYRTAHMHAHISALAPPSSPSIRLVATSATSGDGWTVMTEVRGQRGRPHSHARMTPRLVATSATSGDAVSCVRGNAGGRTRTAPAHCVRYETQCAGAVRGTSHVPPCTVSRATTRCTRCYEARLTVHGGTCDSSAARIRPIPVRASRSGRTNWDWADARCFHSNCAPPRLVVS